MAGRTDDDDSDPGPVYYSVREVAARLGLTPRHVRRLDHLLGPYIRTCSISGRTYRQYKQESVDNFALKHLDVELAKASLQTPAMSVAQREAALAQALRRKGSK